MVFKIDYPVTEDPAFPGLVKDLALLAKTGYKLVIVPGVRENIDAVLKQHDIETSTSAYSSECNSTECNSTEPHMNEGSPLDFPIRITTSRAIPYVEMAAFDVICRFMTFFSGSRVDAIIGNFVRARGLGIINGVDTGHTGTVDKIYADSLNKMLDLGTVPIIPCVSWSPSGKPYNIPSDEIALAVSKTLGASKLFIVSAHGALKIKDINIDENIKGSFETRQDGSLIHLSPAQTSIIAQSLGQRNCSVYGHHYRDFKLAFQASKSGVHRIHIIDGRENGAILKELFSNLGVGTMINTDEYDSIRSLHSRDLPDILRLMEPSMQSGILIRRNAEQIQEKKNDYSVFEIDGSIRACGALHDWGENQGEIAAVATDLQYSALGLGRQIVNFLIGKARKSNMHRVFVLTTQTQDWFESIGFKEVAVDSLPEKKRVIYDQTRKSKVFALEL
jgi:amino-acid N-acetyltransferase